MNVFIGLDTSCYTTSVAAADDSGRVLESARMLLPVPAGARGLRQSEAVFVHVRQLETLLPRVMTALRERFGGVRVLGVGASATPRSTASDEDSYMPVFRVGVSQAACLAAALGVPLFTTSHQAGHLMAGRVVRAETADGTRDFLPEDGDAENAPSPAAQTVPAPADADIPPHADELAFHISGGTTELLAPRAGDPLLREIQLLGGSLDLHAGQLVDRVGVRMGLPFPAGPSLEKLAFRGRSAALLPANLADDDLACHLSGAETRLMRLLDALPPAALDADGLPDDAARADLARETFDLLARTLSRMAVAGAKQTGARRVRFIGGVASSALLREMLRARLGKRRDAPEAVFGLPEYSGDNAVGVSLLTMRALRG